MVKGKEGFIWLLLLLSVAVMVAILIGVLIGPIMPGMMGFGWGFMWLTPLAFLILIGIGLPNPLRK